MRIFAGVLGLVLIPTALPACGGDGDRDDGLYGGGGDDGGPGPGDDDDGAPGGGDGNSGGDGDDGDGSDDPGGGDGGVKFDTPDGSGGPGDDQVGCDKVDFLFVVDNSGSMADEQTNLVTSFPGFMATVQDTLMAQDFHIMTVDTDALAGATGTTCSPDPDCCASTCAFNPAAICNGHPCMGMSTTCDDTMGAGRVKGQVGADCGIDSGQRYMLDSQADLSVTFECVSRVGTNGNGDEQPMSAMLAATGVESDPGGCNEGFLRDDAILVVTIISDEDDTEVLAGLGVGGSPGEPGTWFDQLVAEKAGNPQAIVVLGILDDSDEPGSKCVTGGSGNGEEPSVRLRSFVDMFGAQGMRASVCEPDFAPFFEQAVSVIDTTCDDFTPPG